MWHLPVYLVFYHAWYGSMVIQNCLCLLVSKMCKHPLLFPMVRWRPAGSA